MQKTDRLAEFCDDDWVPREVWAPLFGDPNDMLVWRWQRSKKVRFPRFIKIGGKNHLRVGDLRECRKRLAEEPPETPPIVEIAAHARFSKTRKAGTQSEESEAVKVMSANWL